MSYAAAVDHLYALGHELHPAGPAAPRRKFDLAHMRVLAQALGDPQTTFPSVLIAGTNGKGSTAATLSSILTAAGYRTALYTSPHLMRVNERIQINGRPISDDDFARLYFHVDDTAQRLVREGALPHHPSFFEVLTALAFLYFSGNTDRVSGNSDRVLGNSGRVPHSSQLHRDEWGTNTSPVDIAVLEVGMGGRLDATNIVEPLLSIITDISLDHQEYLGHTIAEIAREKAGILRPSGTLITLPQHPEANQAIGEAAATLNLRAINAARFIPPTTPHDAGKDCHPERSGEALEPNSADEEKNCHPERSSEAAQSKDPRLSLFTPNRYTLTLDNEPLAVDSPLSGHHQQRNLALAIAAAVELRSECGYKISNEAIETGIRNTQWPGRLELVPTEPPILLDVGHNPAGAWTLRAAIAQLPEDQPRTLIFSCLRDKSLTEMAQILFPLFDRSNYRPYDHIILCPVNNPRAATLEALAEAARALDVPAHAAPDIAAALAQARTLTPPNGLIIATGSVYLVGDLRTLALAP